MTELRTAFNGARPANRPRPPPLRRPRPAADSTSSRSSAAATTWSSRTRHMRAAELSSPSQGASSSASIRPASAISMPRSFCAAREFARGLGVSRHGHAAGWMFLTAIRELRRELLWTTSDREHCSSRSRTRSRRSAARLCTACARIRASNALPGGSDNVRCSSTYRAGTAIAKAQRCCRAAIARSCVRSHPFAGQPLIVASGDRPSCSGCSAVSLNCFSRRSVLASSLDVQGACRPATTIGSYGCFWERRPIATKPHVASAMRRVAATDVGWPRAVACRRLGRRRREPESWDRVSSTTPRSPTVGNATTTSVDGLDLIADGPGSLARVRYEAGVFVDSTAPGILPTSPSRSRRPR